MTATQPQTFSRTITVCAKCGTEVSQVAFPGTIRPCGHEAHLKIIPNPKLPK